MKTQSGLVKRYKNDMPKRDITIVRNSVESVYGFLDYLDRNVPGASKYTKYIKLEFVQNSKAIWFVDANNNRVTVNVLYSITCDTVPN
jgi:hypothetical protein